MIMWQRTYSKLYKDVDKHTLWQLWTDIDHWPEWHSDLEYCKLIGGFQEGSYFMLKPKNQRAVKIILTEINEGVSFTDCTKFPGTKMYDTHKMEVTKEGLLLTNICWVTGPLSWLWVKLVANNVANTIADEMEAVVQLARQKHAA